MKGLIESIENDRNSDAFREPVDWEGKFVHNLRLTGNDLFNDSNTLTFALYSLRNGSFGLPANRQEPHGLSNL